MKFDKFIRETAYFQTLRDGRFVITAKDLDSNFKDLADYINNKLNKYVNIPAGEIGGILNSQGALLKNVGDGSTIFSLLKTNDLTDDSISTLKLKKTANQGSIISTSETGLFVEIPPLAPNLILKSQPGSEPKWGKIKGSIFARASINKSKVGLSELGAGHLAPGILGRSLFDSSIKTSLIKDSSLLNTNFSTGSFTEAKLQNSLKALKPSFANTQDTGAAWIFGPKQVLSRHIQNASFDLNRFIIQSVDFIARVNSYKQIFQSANIPEKSLVLTSKVVTGVDANNPEYNNFRINSLARKFQILPEHFLMNLSLVMSFILYSPRNSYKSIAAHSYLSFVGLSTNNSAGRISKTKLSAEVRQKLGI